MGSRGRFRPSLLETARYKLPVCMFAVNTTTPEKVAHLNIGARGRKVPINFISLKGLKDQFRSAKETAGTAKGNAFLKFAEADKAAADFKSNPVFEHVLRRKHRVLFGEDIPLKKNHIGMGPEDSEIILMDPAVWGIVEGWLRPYVTEDVLKRCTKNKYGSGPAAETGPIAGAIGWYALFEMFRLAALECGYDKGKALPLLDRCECVMTALGDGSEDPIHELSTEMELCLARKDLTVPFAPPPPGVIEASRYFMAEPGAPGVSLNKIWADYLPYRSPRAQMAEKIYFTLTGLKVRPPARHVQSVWKPSKKVHVSSFVKGFVDQDAIARHKETLEVRAKERDIMTAALDMTALIHTPDCVIFPPLSKLTSPIDIDTALYAAISASESKKIDSASIPTPIIFMNDGSWTPFMNILINHVNAGTGKGYEEDVLFPTMPQKLRSGATHRCLCHMDFIEADNDADLQKGAEEIAAFRRQSYAPYVSPGDLETDTRFFGEWPDGNAFCSYGYTSASTDNRIAIEHAYAHGRILAENGFREGSGGGDDHAMGAERKGYLGNGGKRDESVSTHAIVKLESTTGRLPISHTGILCEDIYQREAYMLLLQTHGALLLGGGGSLKEMLSWKLARHYVPAAMTGKELLIHSPNIHTKLSKTSVPFWINKGIELFVTRPEIAMLFKDPNALAHKGIYLSQTIPEMETQIKASAARWQALGPKANEYAMDIVKRSVDRHIKRAAQLSAMRLTA